MNRDSCEPGKQLVKHSNKVQELIERLSAEEDAATVATFQAMLNLVRQIEVVDLWDMQDVAQTYWILLLTGVNQNEEMCIAKDLLAWQAFFAKESARVLCVQSSERGAFRCCTTKFAAHNFPALILSDTPDMVKCIKFEPDLLKGLWEQVGGLQSFLAKIQSMIESGMSIEGVQEKLNAQAFWKGLRLVYKEVRDLISLIV